MRKKNYKGRCEKRRLNKNKVVCRFYNDIQARFADELQNRDDIIEFRCNVLLDTDDYTTDFVCTKSNGEFMVRECIERKLLMKPMTVQLVLLLLEEKHFYQF